MRALAIVTLLAACSPIAASRELSGQSRAQQLAGAFTKQRHVVAEHRGVRREKYKDVQSEPVVRPNLTEYSGVYEVAELAYVITLRAGADGRIQGEGHEGARAFELENARIAGAVLTATKTYRDGRVEPFEGVFLTRTARHAPDDPGTMTVGLGVVLRRPVEFAGNTYDKVFYQLKG